MKNTFIVILAILTFQNFNVPAYSQTKTSVPANIDPLNTKMEFWLTSPETNVLFQRQTVNLIFGNQDNPNPTISVDTTQTFQTIDGFGNCLTGGSATLLHRMKPESRTAILKELFATDGNNIGISYLRVSIGASDLSAKVFSYNDLPEGETDTEMVKFSLDTEKAD